MRDELLKLKLYQMRAQSHTGYIITALSLAIAIATYLKVSNINGWYSVAIFFAIVCLNLFIGYLDVKNGIFAAEQKINNAHNPDLQELLRRTKK